MNSEPASGDGPVVIESVAALKAMVGREFVAAHWVSIDQERIQRFAEVTNDLQWIHTDAERAQRESPFGTTIAHGFLTLSLLSHFMSDAITIGGGLRLAVNYGLEKVRFPAPVRTGEAIRARFLLRTLTDVLDGVQAVFVATVEVSNAAKPCCVAEWVMRYYL